MLHMPEHWIFHLSAYLHLVLPNNSLPYTTMLVSDKNSGHSLLTDLVITIKHQNKLLC